MMAERAVRVIVSGRVQGVGFRAFVRREALARKISGWVRNRRDGSVEAVFSGDVAAVEALVGACRRGPRVASVTAVEVADHGSPIEPGFSELATA